MTHTSLLATCGSLSLVLAAHTAQAQSRPNIVIINLDDVGCGDFGCTGAMGYTTPHIDRMAGEGMRFTQFLTCQPVSGSSRAALLTGCYSNRVGFWGAPDPNYNRIGIHAQEMTLGELLKQRGYATAIFGKWHLGDQRPFLPLQNGFDEYYGLPYSNDMWPYHPHIKNFPDLPLIEGNEIIAYNPDQTRLTTDYTTRAVSFIDRHKEEPFFLYLAHSMAHVPLFVSDRFKGKSERGLYGDVMMEVDWSVGEVLAALERNGLDENTWVVLTSDNGPWHVYGDHAGSNLGFREAKQSTWEGGNRLPCIMRWKGQIPAASVCNQLAINFDLFATAAEIADAPLPDHKIDGKSLLPLITGKTSQSPHEHFAYYFDKNNLRAVTDGRYKLVFPHQYQALVTPGRDGMPGKGAKLQHEELSLYDLWIDAGERYDVKEQHPDVVESLQQYAATMRQDLGDDLQGVKGSGRRPAGIPPK